MEHKKQTDNVRYIKRQNARSTIGFLSEHLVDEYNTSIWNGIRDATWEQGANLIYFSGGILRDPRGFDAQANILYDLVDKGNLDGLVLWGAQLAHYTTLDELTAFCEQYHPLPIINIGLELEGIPCLLVDNYQGMYDVVTHLVEVHGYRRIAYICGPGETPEVRDRYRGYTDALAEHHVPLDPALVVTSSELRDESWQKNVDFGEVGVSILLDRRKLRPQVDFEALVGHDDGTSLRALHALRGRGFRVPTDVALASFDDIQSSQYLTPPLTTARQSFYDLGWRGVEMLLARLRGEEVSARVVLPMKVMVRQSCGCEDPMVAAAGSMDEHSDSRTSQRNLQAALSEDWETVIGEMVRGMKAPEDAFCWAEQVLKSFIADVEGESPGIFLQTLNDVLYQMITADDASLPGSGQDVAPWQGALSGLRRHLLPLLDDNRLRQAENLWQQARVLIGETARRVQAYQALQAEQRAQTLREIGAALITMFDVEELMNVLAAGLSRLRIPSAYLSVYENPQLYTYPQPAPEWSRLMLAYNKADASRPEQVELGSDGRRFRSRQLVPEGLRLQERQYSFVVNPLYFRDHQIGFILFEVGPREGSVYEVLRGQISSALQGALLVQRVQERSAEIVRQKYILDTFMANVPDSIYFKDLESCFIRANRSLATLFGVTEPAQLIGKSDFDFFPDAQARPKYEQEQEIIQTGHVMNLEEPDAQGRWSLTTKMPLRDEHGEIIGTFGISRDITELKQAQHALEHAYSEINNLNEQLKEENLRMSAELSVARQLQAMILPSAEELRQITGIDIVGYMQPADEVGGDYYDVLKGNGVIHIGIGDVTGHGLESEVLMLMTQATIRTLIEHGETNPVALVNTLNRTIYKNVRRMGADKTLTFALINYQGGQLEIVGQHESILVVRKGGQVERVDTIDLGFPIGLEEEIAQWVTSATVSLQTGDGVVLYTDGITEAENVNKQLYGLEWLCDVVSRNWDKSAEGIKQAVIDDITRYIGTQKVYDDLTLVILKQR